MTTKTDLIGKDLVKAVQAEAKKNGGKIPAACEAVGVGTSKYYFWKAKVAPSKPKVKIKTYSAKKPLTATRSRIKAMAQASIKDTPNFFMVSGTPAQIAEFAKSFGA